MKSHWNKFRKNKFYLPLYFLVSLLIIATLDMALIALMPERLDLKSISLNWNHLFLLPIGLIIGVQVPALMHNCVHGNLKIKPLNFIMGELAGLYTLLGMAAFEINHRMHHTHSDTDLDPHNPEGKNFFFFLFANNFGGTRPVMEKYLKFHGDTATNRGLFHAAVFFHFFNVPFRLILWFMILGPSLFLLFFIPSYLFHIFVFAHINFYTHEILSDGSNVVYNLDSNLYYRLVNKFGSGVYYHKNHHKNPNHYNPMKGASTSWLFR